MMYFVQSRDAVVATSFDVVAVNVAVIPPELLDEFFKLLIRHRHAHRSAADGFAQEGGLRLAESGWLGSRRLDCCDNSNPCYFRRRGRQ